MPDKNTSTFSWTKEKKESNTTTPISKNVVDTTFGYDGNKVIFTDKKRKEKAATHAELEKPYFIGRVKKTLEDACVIYKDHAKPESSVCVYSKPSASPYVKVVVYMHCKPYNVVTAYYTDWIKEETYMGLRIKG